MSEICNECGKSRYHNIKTDKREECVEIIHHSTASVIQINFYTDENPFTNEPDIRKSEEWMGYGVFKKLYEEIQNKANGSLNFLIK